MQISNILDATYSLLTSIHPCVVSGEIIHEHSGANKQKLEDGLQSCLTPEENPMTNANPFQIQMWHAKAGI